jgi:Lamin Tail Domain
MKKYLLIAIFCLLKLFAAAQTDCKDLIISEVYYGIGDTGVSDTSLLLLNHMAIELYNPTDSIISLGNYHIKLSANSSSSTDVTLGGYIKPHKTFVVCDSTRVYGIDTTIAQLITPLLNYNGYNAVHLYKHTTLVDTAIDQAGQLGLSSADSISLARVLSVHGYLDSLNLDLRSLRGYDFRRSVAVTKGRLDFNNLQGKWLVYSASDASHLGRHNSICDASLSGSAAFRGTTSTVSAGIDITYYVDATGPLPSPSDPSDVASVSWANFVPATFAPSSIPLLSLGDFDGASGTTCLFNTDYTTRSGTFKVHTGLPYTGFYALYFQLTSADLTVTNEFRQYLIDFGTGINELSQINQIYLYNDNQANSINVTGSALIKSIVITDVIGRTIVTDSFKPQAVLKIDSGNFAKGYYIVSAQLENNVWISKKVFKE